MNKQNVLMEQLFIIGVDNDSLNELKKLAEEAAGQIDDGIKIVPLNKLEQILNADLISVPALKFHGRVFYYKNIQKKGKQEQISDLKNFLNYE